MKIHPAVADLMFGFEQENRRRIKEAAQKDPLRYKTTSVAERGTGTRYYQHINGKGQEVRFCWSTGRNVAGFFLFWRETIRKDGRVKNDMIGSRRKRNAAKAICRRRWEAAKK